MAKNPLSYFCQVIAAPPLSREHSENALAFFALLRIFDKSKSLFAREFEQVLVAQRICDVKSQLSGLPRSKKLSWAAQRKVRFGDFEPIRGAHHGVEPGARLIGHAKRGHQDAVRLVGASADAPAKLVELREPEALGMLNHHHRGVRHVHADLHHRSGHQDVHVVPVEALHDFLFRFA